MDSHRFLNSDVPEPEVPQFEALGHAGSEVYAGLETFPNPGVVHVAYTSDEVMAVCPITKQPDFYTVTIEVADTEKLIESKSLKLWFQNLMADSIGNRTGIFCENLAVYLRDTVAAALDTTEDHVRITLVQKSRGGISIKAVA
jgi:NADPH-dependent 7-cyano-7-deazaguanine reductase QueF